MISIDRVYKTILKVVNTDIRGNITPSDIRDFLNLTVNEIYEDYLFEVNRLVNRENKHLIGNGLENLPDRVREKIMHFHKDAPLAFVTSLFQLPSDLRYIDSIYYNDAEIEPCKNAKEFKIIIKCADTKPTVDYPIYLQQGATIKVSPNTINANVVCYYLRKPLIAKWTYTVISNTEIFNPSASDFQDIDLHPSEESNVVIKTLLKCGVNLKEQDLQAMMMNIENKDFNKENAS